MAERITHERIAFQEPVFAESLGRALPAGTYKVEIVEELIEGLSFMAYRTASTSIALPLRAGVEGSWQMVRIDPEAVRRARRAADSSRLGANGATAPQTSADADIDSRDEPT